MSNLKEYEFRNVVTVVEETTVEAKNYSEAVNIFIKGGGDTIETDSYGDNWECINNPDDWEDDEDDDDE